MCKDTLLTILWCSVIIVPFLLDFFLAWADKDEKQKRLFFTRLYVWAAFAVLMLGSLYLVAP